MLKGLYLLWSGTRLFFFYGKYVLLKMFKNIWKKKKKSIKEESVLCFNPGGCHSSLTIFRLLWLFLWVFHGSWDFPFEQKHPEGQWFFSVGPQKLLVGRCSSRSAVDWSVFVEVSSTVYLTPNVTRLFICYRSTIIVSGRDSGWGFYFGKPVERWHDFGSQRSCQSFLALIPRFF